MSADPLLHIRQQMLMQRPWHAAESGSLWLLTGEYPKKGGTFTRCAAIVLPDYVTGVDEPLFAFLPPLDGVVAAEQITHATRLRVVLDDTGEEVEL